MELKRKNVTKKSGDLTIEIWFCNEILPIKKTFFNSVFAGLPIITQNVHFVSVHFNRGDFSTIMNNDLISFFYNEISIRRGERKDFEGDRKHVYFYRPYAIDGSVLYHY